MERSSPLKLSRPSTTFGNISVTIEGPGSGELTIAASATDHSQVFTVASGSNAEIDGLRITGGSGYNGGGIGNSGNLTIADCIINGNTASGPGGGVSSYSGRDTLAIQSSRQRLSKGKHGLNHRSGATTTGDSSVNGNTPTLVLIDSTVSGNSSWAGGGIFIGYGSATITHSTISQNSSYGSGGGGIYDDGSLIIQENSTISSNTAYYSVGGGIEDFGNITITNSTISGNSAPKGGGIYNASALTIDDSTISNNSAVSDGGYAAGGGIYDDSHNTSQPTITNSTIGGNTTTGNGGGIANYSEYTSGYYSMALSNSTIYGNSAGGNGGGIANYYNTTITDCTISGNSAGGVGGGLNAAATTTLRGSIIDDNTNGGDLAGSFGGSYNLSGQIITGGFTAGNHDKGGTALLSPLGYYGGPTETMALLPGSAAIGYGAPSNISGVTTDQRGFTRPASVTPDIGAFQSNGTPGTGVVMVSPIVINPVPLTVGSAATFSVTASVVSYANDSLVYNWTLINLSSLSTPITSSTTQPTLPYTPSVTGNWTVTVTVTDITHPQSTTVGPQRFTVAAAPALQVVGPGAVNEGGPVAYTLNSGANATWTATQQNGSEDFASTGTTFNFTPENAGTFTITATTVASGVTQTASAILTVSYFPPTVTISGMATAPASNALVFGSNVTQAPGIDDPISYAWQLLNANGSIYQFPSGQTPTNGLASYLIPDGLPVGSYQVRLTIQDQDNTASSPVSSFSFSTLQDAQSNLTYATIPYAQTFGGISTGPSGTLPDAGFSDTDDDFADGQVPTAIVGAIAQQSDGKIVVAIDFPSAGPYENIAPGALLARFNANLTLDTTFGVNHTGVEPAGGTALEPVINQLLIDPFNNDIITIGTATGAGQNSWQRPFLQVAEYLSSETVEPDGQVLAPGSLDPNFNNSGQTYGPYELNPGSDTYESRGDTGFVFDGPDINNNPNPNNGMIIVGGSTTTYTNTPDTSFSDFLLLALSPVGQLDWIAAQPHVSGEIQGEDDGRSSPPSAPFGDQYGSPGAPGSGESTGPSAAIDSLVLVNNDTQIVVGGYGYTGDLDGQENIVEGDLGMVLVRYNLSSVDGSIAAATIDPSFGYNGEVFTNSEVFTPGTADGFAVLNTMEVVGNNILAVGIAGADPGYYYETDPTAHVVFAEYDAQTGAPNAQFGTQGVIVTPVTVETGWNWSIGFLNEEQEGTYSPGTGGSFAFDTNGGVVASIETPTGWELTRFILSNGSVDTAFGANGTIDLASSSSTTGELALDQADPNNWSFSFANMPSAFVITNEGIIAGGCQYDASYFGGDNTEDAGQPSCDPFVVQYSDNTIPSVTNTNAVETSTGAVTVTWNVSGPGEGGFEIERSMSLNSNNTELLNPVLVGQVGPNQTDFSDDTDLNPNTTYYYQAVPVLAVPGQQTLGASTGFATVKTFPSSGTQYVLEDTIDVPLTNGSQSHSTIRLTQGQTYLLVASGVANLGDGLTGDGAYWYSDSDPKSVYGSAFSDVNSTVDILASEVPYGIAIGDYITGSTEPTSIPAWGLPDLDHNTYTYAIVGDGHQLNIDLSGLTNLSASDVGGSTPPLQVQIYAVNSQHSPGSSSSDVTMITSPATLPDGTTQVISASMPISVLVANTNGTTQVPWALWLVTATSPVVRTLLASGADSVGQLPIFGAQVATLDPSLYPNGQYALQLTSSSNANSPGSVLDSRPITISTAVKSGSMLLPVTDATGVVKVTRVYNSSRVNLPPVNDWGDTNILPTFGPGWSLSLLDSQLSVTEQANTYLPASGSGIYGLTPTTVLRAGDLVYLTVPDDGQHVFEFEPIPVEELTNSASLSSLTYIPSFVAVDGSGATLALSDDYDNNIVNYYPSDNEYGNEADFSTDGGGGPVPEGFVFAADNSTLPGSAGNIFNQFRLTTKDGTSYLIDAITGAILSVTDTSGATTTYTYDTSPNASGTVTANLNGQSQPLFTIITNNNDEITSITGQVSATYGYTNRNLTSVINLAGNETLYSYQDPANPNHLTGIINVIGQTVLQAQYDPITGELDSLTNAVGVTIPVSSANLGGNEVLQTVVDAAGDITQNVYDETYGNLLRKIQLATDSSGNPYYVVTVNAYSYVNDDLAEMSPLQPSGITLLQSVEQFPSFEIQGSDPTGLRFSEQPASNSWTTQTVFDTSDNVLDNSRGQIISESQRLNSASEGTGLAGELQTTLYSNYTGSNLLPTESNDPVYNPAPLPAPRLVTVEIQKPDANSVTGYDNYLQSVTYSSYDSYGDIQYTLTSLGVPDVNTNDPAGSVLAEGIEYNYNGGVDPRLLSSKQSVTASIAPNGTVNYMNVVATLAQNTYYSTGSVYGGPAGSVYGGLEYTINAAGQETYYAYNALGEQVLAYTYKKWTDSRGTHYGWVGTTTAYNTLGQATDTYVATYLDPNWNTDGNIGSVQTLPVTTGGLVGVQVDPSTIYSGFNGGQPLRTSHNDYNAIGQKIDSIDQDGGETYYTYNANGNLIRTVYPNGTETRSVYDALGRAIWTTINPFVPTDRSDPADPANTTIVTHAIYNQLGQVIETDQYQNAAIEIGGTAEGSTFVAQSSVNTSSAVLISQTFAYYNAQGEAAETVSASGLRSGTIYYPDGQVQYAGQLPGSGPETVSNADAWYNNIPASAYQSDGSLSSTYLDSLFPASQTPGNTHAQYTTNKYDQIDANGNIYDAVIDANGNETDTYKDPEGRVIKTVYPDGSFTETLYGIGGSTVTQDLEGDPISNPTGWQPIPTDAEGAGSETVQIVQRKSTDPIVATYDVYDPAGNLVDVYQPTASVVEGNQTADVNPQWTYVYDASGDETKEISPNEQTGGTFAGDVTTFAYDQFGNEVKRTLPDGEYEIFTYNQYNQEATHTDFDGNVATYTYYSGYGNGAYRGDLEQVQYVGASGSGKTTQTVTYTYTPLGQQYQVTDASGTTTYTYDAFGNMTQAETPEGTINYVFDPVTQLHTETWTEASGTTTDKSNAITDILYGYDAQGRLASVSQAKINGSTPPAVSGGILYNADGVASSTTLPTTLYTYDNNGNLLSVADPNGDTTTYTYDLQNRLTYEVVTNSADVTIFWQHYSIGDNGLRSSVEEKEYTATGTLMSDTTTSWTYDNEGRLLTETSSITGGAQQYQDTYTYDLDNNRLTKTDVSSAGTAVTTDSYNGDDELLTETETLGGSTVYTTRNAYDANGSLITSVTGGQTTTYTYDVRNKMVGYSSPGGSATYVYDDAGNRVQETTNGTTTYYLTDTQDPTDHAQQVEQWVSTNGTRSTATLAMTYVLGNSVLAQVTGGGTVSYLLTDGHGSTRALTNSSGIITSNSNNNYAVFDYDAFGTPLNFTAATAGTVFLFGGDAVYDPVSGLYMNGDGTRDRLGFEFIQMDPTSGSTQDPISLHEYLYCDADPINGNDPSGYDDSLLADEAFSEANGDIAEDVGGYTAVYVALTGGITVADISEDNELAIASLAISVYQTYAQAWQTIAQNVFLGAAGAFLGQAAEAFAAADVEAGGATSVQTLEEIGEVDSEVAAAEEGTALAGQLGRAGENAANIIKNTERIASITGTAMYRVPDILEPAADLIGDVKNVARLAFTSQIQDSLYYALEKGYRFVLIVRKSTTFTKPLQALIDAGFVTVQRSLP